MKLKCTHVAEGEEDWFTAGKTYDVIQGDAPARLHFLIDDTESPWSFSHVTREALERWFDSEFEEVVE